jgi:hypothetical protein
MPKRISSIRSVAPLPATEAPDLEPARGTLTPRMRQGQLPAASPHPSSGLNLSLALEDAKGWLSSVQRRLETLHHDLDRARPSTRSKGGRRKGGERGQQLLPAAASTVEQVEEPEEPEAHSSGDGAASAAADA